MAILAQKGRIVITPEGLGYKFYISDYPVVEITNLWEDTAGVIRDMLYVVQTNPKIVERCILMTTDPGDLVFDPTCGSGTTAYCAEFPFRIPLFLADDISQSNLALGFAIDHASDLGSLVESASAQDRSMGGHAVFAGRTTNESRHGAAATLVDHGFANVGHCRSDLCDLTSPVDRLVGLTQRGQPRDGSDSA